MNYDLAALHHFCLTWQINFPPNKAFLLIFLKCDLHSFPQPPLLLNDSIIPETKVLGFTFDLLLT